ncbi:cytochrome c oxidase assembly protein [Pseudactinotalea sp. HY160]|uniref:cytochrome c oxidase assembly protein n=1 Tax=Pseudactinotalea sp. HY160 TaxID=2654490 RepID=UPI00351AEAA4
MARTQWQRMVWWVAGIAGTLVVAAALALALSGSAEATLLADPGVLVRWGRPIINGLADLAASVTIGGSMLLVFVLAVRTPAWERARTVVAAAATVWTIALTAQLVFTYAAVSGRPIGEPGFGNELAYYLTELGAGKARLVTLILAALTSVAAVAIAGWGSALLTLVMSVSVIIPIAVLGHAAGAQNHDLAMNAGFIHIVTVGIWVGALLVLMLVRPVLSAGRAAGAVAGAAARAGSDRGERHRGGNDPSATERPGRDRAGRPRGGRELSTAGPDVTGAAARFSTIAAWCYVGVAVSGIANAVLRLGDLSGLGTTYGSLLIAKIVAFGLLGFAGAWHRRSTIAALAERPRAFWRLAGGELFVMAAAMGLAVVLASTAPPVPQDPIEAPSPAQVLSQRDVPLPPTFGRWFSEFYPDLLFGALTVVMAVVYIRWVLRLRRRGDSWPLGRTVPWLLGVLGFGYLNLGGAAVYGHILFSAHMIAHMSLVMILPILLVLGAPVTLAVRALPARHDGSRGPREWLLAIVHSRWAGFLSNPIVAAGNVIVSMAVFYFTPLIVFAMTTHIGHVLMIVHFTLIGYLFVNVLIGIDPGPTRPGYPLRLVLLLATMAFHAFFALAIMSMTDLIGADYFGRLGLPWGVDALADQYTGGQITWGIGELPSLALAVTLALMWAKTDERTARRTDRQADRDGGAELAEYNAMLARLADEEPEDSSHSPTR